MEPASASGFKTEGEAMNTGMVFEGQRENREPAAPLVPLSGYLRFANFHVDLKREELFKDGTRMRLPGKVYQALLALLEQPGEVVSREALRLRLWPEGTHVNYDANVNTTVNKLRQALGDTPEEPRFVETVPRQGYSFVASVERMASAPQSSGKRPDGVSHSEEKAPGRASLLAGGTFGTGLTPGWLKAGAVSLVVAGMLFGAALVIYARHVF